MSDDTLTGVAPAPGSAWPACTASVVPVASPPAQAPVAEPPFLQIEQLQVTFTGGATAVPVTWTPEAGEPYNGNDYYKSGTINPDGTITWTIQLAAAADGMAQTLDNLVITDKLATPMELASAPVLFEATELSSSGQWPAYHEADASTYAVTTDPVDVVVREMISGFTVNVPVAKQGHWYYVSFDTRVPADAPGGAT